MSNEQGRRPLLNRIGIVLLNLPDGATWTDSFDFTYRPAATPRSPG